MTRKYYKQPKIHKFCTFAFERADHLDPEMNTSTPNFLTSPGYLMSFLRCSRNENNILVSRRRSHLDSRGRIPIVHIDRSVTDFFVVQPTIARRRQVRQLRASDRVERPARVPVTRLTPEREVRREAGVQMRHVQGRTREDDLQIRSLFEARNENDLQMRLVLQARREEDIQMRRALEANRDDIQMRRLLETRSDGGLQMCPIVDPIREDDIQMCRFLEARNENYIQMLHVLEARREEDLQMRRILEPNRGNIQMRHEQGHEVRRRDDIEYNRMLERYDALRNLMSNAHN